MTLSRPSRLQKYLSKKEVPTRFESARLGSRVKQERNVTSVPCFTELARLQSCELGEYGFKGKSKNIPYSLDDSDTQSCHGCKRIARHVRR